MRKWVVGLGVALFAVSAMSSAAFADKKKTYTSTTTTESGVRNVCGGDLQSNGGVIGCTKQCGQSTCDYSCGGPEGKGCRTHVFTRAAPTGNKVVTGTELTTKQKAGEVAKPKSASASPPKASLVSDTSSGASMKTNSKTKNLTNTTTTTTAPVSTTGVSR